MELVLVRVDDRLIHGQVVVGWTRTVKGNRIVVVNDEISTNKMQITLLKMATPAGVKSDILSVGQAVKNLSDGTYGKENVIILAKEPKTVAALIEQGIPIKKVNIGNCRAAEGKTKLLKGVSASPEDIRFWKQLDDQGVVLEAQGFPDQPKYDFNEIICAQTIG